jgi:membrane-bound metal-dependent hydrolase YbcI (DUF457 family)|tara:strand:+ start:760 stop:1269 length:510 start_codon:yes stop_codon:yes gene_type:complete
MFINSHLASGYILAKTNLFDKKWIPLWLLAAVIPDIDGLWSRSVVEHHSVLHTPFPWVVLCGAGWIYGYIKGNSDLKTISIIIFIGSFLHLFTDYVTARTVGVKWLYPLNNTDYYLYDISPEKGDIPIWQMLIPPYVLFYMENKVLAFFELFINMVALVLYFFSIKKAY